MAGNMTGRLLNNRYLVGERIGIGGMAEVYKGQDNVLGRTVAIKVMLPQYAEDASFTARFRQEAAASANLQSPYIVNVYDWGQDTEADTSFIIMEYVRGSDLKTAINQRGAINQRKVAEIGSQVCQALAVAHNLDIIHRDIKPQNIMVQPDGNVKVMDFGIARAKNSVMAKTSSVLGTAHYISPEQAQGKDLTAASDIYSLGVVLYEAATGKLPFDGPDAVSVALKQVSDEPEPPHNINPDIDVALETIIMKAMCKNPRDRFATARDMRHALNDYLAGRPVNIGGFSGAPTAVIGEGISAEPTQTIGGYQPEQTAVMSGTAVGVNPVNTNQSRTYVEPINTKKKHSKGKTFLIVLLCAIIAIAAVAGISYTLLGQGISPTTGKTVPDVTHKTLEQATSAIEEAGFVVGEIDQAYSDTIEADIVMSQKPRGGSTQEEGTKIDLTISQGIEQVEVPDLTDMNANDARAALSKVGLGYEAGAAEYSDTVKENRVMRQSPSAGEMVDKGSTVTYYLSAGEETVTVPNVLEIPEADAKSTLENAGFVVVVQYADSDYLYGTVINQTPSANGKAKSGSTVTLTVSNGSMVYTEPWTPEEGTNSGGSGELAPDGTQTADQGDETQGQGQGQDQTGVDNQPTDGTTGTVDNGTGTDATGTAGTIG